MSGGIFFSPNKSHVTSISDEVVQQLLDAAVGADVAAALDTQVPAAPTPGSLNDILSATDGNTYDRSTDSLEALGGTTITIYEDLLTIGSVIGAIASNVANAVTLLPQRSSQSGSLLMDGTEQTVYEYEGGSSPIIFYHGHAYVSNVDAVANYKMRTYCKIENGGSYIQTGEYAASAAIGWQAVAQNTGNPAGSVAYLPRENVHGIKITIQQIVEGTAYRTVKFEFYDSVG